MLLLRSVVFVTLFYVTTAIILVVGSPLLLGPRWAAMAGLAFHARWCLWLMRVVAGTRVDVRGAEKLPKGAALVASKHQSAWETFALIPLFPDPAMVMKDELKWIPLYGWFSLKFEHILVKRQRGPAALRRLIAEAREKAAKGRQIVIFPEGTRQNVDAPPSYKPGVLALYEGLELSCVPLALNSGLFWPRGSLMRYPGTIVIEVLEPIPPHLPRDEFRQRLETAIETATAHLVAEARATSPVLAA